MIKTRNTTFLLRDNFDCFLVVVANSGKRGARSQPVNDVHLLRHVCEDLSGRQCFMVVGMVVFQVQEMCPG